ncbi:cation:proton antiporter [Angustibacter luteus]|uniref:Cation:proton antiporter n=1 Tax=Angustibacter luteus TaxID=658456 RepID=A0ABW1JC58_9ACTN
MDVDVLRNLVVLLSVAVAAPLLADRLRPVLLVPTVVLELVLGIVVGPDLLGWVQDSTAISGLSNLGLALLMFLAGYEIDFAKIRGLPVSLGLRSWGVSLAIGLVIGLVTATVSGHLSVQGVALGLIVTTTAVGTLLPILRDRGELETSFGPFVLAAGAIGEFCPLIGLSLFLASDRPVETAGVLLLFVAAALVVVWLALRSRTPRVIRMVGETLTTSAQLGVRVGILLCILLVWVATAFDLDFLLGAFTAGIILRLFLASSPREEVEVLESKLEAVGFGFLVPIFFVMSGVRLDLQALIEQPLYLLLLPVALGAFLLVRGGPMLWLYRPVLDAADVKALALYSATALPLVVVMTGIGVDDKLMSPAMASVLVTAAMISVLVLPLLAGRLRPANADYEPADGA